MEKKGVPAAIERFLPVAGWNSLIRQAAVDGDPQKAFLLFRQMKRRSLARPDRVTFLFLAKACAGRTSESAAVVLHGHVIRTPHRSDAYLQTSVIDAYAKCGRPESARKVFDEMPVRDIASWNAILLCHARSGSSSAAAFPSLLAEMRSERIAPDTVTVIALAQLAAVLRSGRLLAAVHCFGTKCGHATDASVVNTYISGYAKCGDLHSAERVFHETGLDSLNVVSWNAAISGSASSGQPSKAVEFYRRMLWEGYRPDLSTAINLASSFQQPDYLPLGRSVHAQGVKLGCDADIAFLNTLISMYSKCGHVAPARSIFNRMVEKSAVTWTAMIGGYSEAGDLDEALSLFDEMAGSGGGSPDPVAVLHLIAACGRAGSLEVGRRLDAFAASTGLKGDGRPPAVCNALMDMYSKCGSVDDAERVFDAMPAKDVVSWTTLISGSALNGKYREAIGRFHRMLSLDLEPNRVTFLAVLQACSHGGLLDEGIHLFNMMTRKYEIEPGVDHCTCIARLLARKGRLREAMEFIRRMPSKPDAGIWGCLLSACRIHRNVEVAEYVAERLFELEPGEAAPYVEMANTYASVDDWKGFAAVRARMRSGEVSKSPGCSWIEVDGRCRWFAAEDRFRCDGPEIFEVLDTLVLIMKQEDDDDDEYCSSNVNS